MKKLISMISILVLVLAGCGSSESEENSIADGVLTIGMDCNYAPYSWTTTEDDPSESIVAVDGSAAYCDGYDVVMAQTIADGLGVELEIKKLPFDGLISALNSGTIDGIMAGMSPTEERKETISFSDSYYTDGTNFTVVVSKDGEYADAQSLEDLDGASITAQLGTLHVGLIEQIPNVEALDPIADYNSMISSVKGGSYDGYIAESPVAAEQVAANSDSLVMLDLVNNENGFEVTPDLNTVAFGLRKDDTQLQSDINEILAQIPDEERIQIMNDAADRAGE